MPGRLISGLVGYSLGLGRHLFVQDAKINNVLSQRLLTNGVCWRRIYDRPMTGAGGKFPGWDEDEFGNLTFSVAVAGQQIQLATVTFDAETDL